MSMLRLVILALIMVSPVVPAFAQDQEQPAYSKETQVEPSAAERSPFIPLIDDNGQMRRDFTKPQIEELPLEVALSGLCSIKGVPYAIIDGELVKQGQIYKELKVEKISPGSVILRRGEKTFTLYLETEKTDEKKK